MTALILCITGWSRIAKSIKRFGFSYLAPGCTSIGAVEKFADLPGLSQKSVIIDLTLLNFPDDLQISADVF